MKENSINIIEQLFERYGELENLRENIVQSMEMIKNAYVKGNKLFICGNGGSASDSEHIVGELLKSFKKKRNIPENLRENLCSLGEKGKYISENLEGSLPAISLTSHLAFSTAYSNDREPCAVFAQQLLGLGKEGDVLICISTSGNSKNCVYASLVAKAMGIKVISLTGEKTSELMNLSEVTINVPETETFKVQELHLPIYHAICAFLEEELFD